MKTYNVYSMEDYMTRPRMLRQIEAKDIDEAYWKLEEMGIKNVIALEGKPLENPAK